MLPVTNPISTRAAGIVVRSLARGSELLEGVLRVVGDALTDGVARAEPGRERAWVSLLPAHADPQPHV